MKKFGYIINPKESKLFELSGGFNKIKLNLPIIKDDFMKISGIYDQDNHYIGDILSSPKGMNFEHVEEKLLKYMAKTQLDFICLGEDIKNKNLKTIQHEKLITGVYGMAYTCVLFIKKYLKEIFDLSIHEAEMIIAIDEYHPFIKEMIRYISSQGNYILLTGKGLQKDEKFLDELFDHHGISIGFNKDYTNVNTNWHVFINFSSQIQLNKLKKKGGEGIIIDPLFLIHEKSMEYKLVNNLGLYSKDIVFFNKLNKINNAYPPQFIECLVRIKNQDSEKNIYELIEQIIENEYTIIDE